MLQKPRIQNNEDHRPELVTVKKAASILGVQYRQLLLSINLSEIPHYRIQKSRRMVRLDEVLAAMKQSPESGVSND